MKALQPLAPPDRYVKWRDLNYGKAVAVVELVDCKPMIDVTIGEFWPEKMFGDFSPGRYAWFLKLLQVIDPFPVIGKQNFFNVDYEWPK